MKKSDYLMKLRRCISLETLEKVYSHKIHALPPEEINAFNSAYDHRKAELTLGKNYDKIPASAWRLVS